MQRGQRLLGIFPRQLGYPLSFRGQVRGTQSSLPCFSAMGLKTRGSSLPSSESWWAQFPAFLGTVKPLRLPAAHVRPLMASPRDSTCLGASCSRCALPMFAKSRIGPGALFRPVLPCRLSIWTRAGSLRFPGDPSRTFALLRDPGRTAEPDHCGFRGTAPAPNTAKASAIT
jgi:hypothetical protein